MKKILLIEDDKHLATLIKIKLEKEGDQVIAMPDGTNALAILQKERPDMLLLDFELPFKNGVEILEEIRKNDEMKSLPVIVISNSGSPVEVLRFQKLGVKDYLIKAELNLNELVNIIGTYSKK